MENTGGFIQKSKTFQTICFAVLFMLGGLLFCNLANWINYIGVLRTGELIVRGAWAEFSWKAGASLIYGIFLCWLIHRKTLHLQIQTGGKTQAFYHGAAIQIIVLGLAIWTCVDEVWHNLLGGLHPALFDANSNMYFDGALPGGDDGFWMILAGACYLLIRFLFDESISLEAASKYSCI